MDSFDSLLMETALAAEEGGTSFDAAFAAALSDSSAPGTVNLAAGNIPPAQVMLPTLSGLIAALRTVVPVQLEVTIPVDSWADSGDEVWPYECRIENSLFEARKRTDVSVAVRSFDTAREAKLCPVSDTQDGFMRIFAQSVPSTDIDATLVVTVVL